jgi:hypothetical protein
LGALLASARATKSPAWASAKLTAARAKFASFSTLTAGPHASRPAGTSTPTWASATTGFAIAFAGGNGLLAIAVTFFSVGFFIFFATDTEQQAQQ